MQKISAVVLTHNNEATIKEAFASVLWCDEIIILDDFSSDGTLENIFQRKAKIYQKRLSGNFAAQRNYALKKAGNEWVLFLDADEVISNELKNEIEKIIQKTDKKGFYITRIDYLWGKRMRFGEFSNFLLLRLARKDAGLWTGSVHEIWDVKGDKGTLRGKIVHYPFQNASEFLAKINYYSSLRAVELFNMKSKANAWSVIFFPAGKLLQNYIYKLGFLDGMQGFIHAIIMSFYSFLVRSKLWILWHEKNRNKYQTV